MIPLFALMLALVAVLLYELRRRVPIWPLSPVWLIIAGYLALGFLGRCGMKWSYAVYGQEFLFITFSSGALDRTLLWFLFCTASFAAGALLWVWVSQSPDLPVELGVSGKRDGGAVWLIVAFGALVLLAIGVGPENLLYRTTYQTSPVAWARIGGEALIPVGVGLSGYVALGFESRLVKAGAILAAIGYLLVTFAMATRFMAVVPVMFALGAFCAQPGSRTAQILFYGGILVSPLLVPVPLVMRNQGEQGLIPFFSVLGTGAELFTHQHILRSAIGQALLSFPLTTFVAERHPLSMSVLWTCLSPMPGRMTNFYEIYPTLMLNSFTPYNTIGMLMNYGPLIGGSFYMAVGFYLSHVDWKIRRDLRRGYVLRSLVLFGFSAFFLLTTTEYVLRSSCRPIYYSIAFEMLIALFFAEGAKEAYPAQQPARISVS